MYARMDDEIRRHVEGLLARQFPEFSVSVGGARRVDGKGIAVYDLSLAQPRGDAARTLRSCRSTNCCSAATSICRRSCKAPRRCIALKSADRNSRSGAARAVSGTSPSLLPIQAVRHGDSASSSSATARSRSPTPSAGDSQPLLLRDIDFTVTPTAQASVVGAWPSVNIEGSLGGPQVKRIDVQAAVRRPAAVAARRR